MLMRRLLCMVGFGVFAFVTGWAQQVRDDRGPMPAVDLPGDGEMRGDPDVTRPPAYTPPPSTSSTGGKGGGSRSVLSGYRGYHVGNYLYSPDHLNFLSLLLLRHGYVYSSDRLYNVYSNRLPLLTQEMIELGLRDSVTHSQELVSLSEEFLQWIQAVAPSEAPDQDRVKELSGRIRKLAQRIRRDRFLRFMDVRREGNSSLERDELQSWSSMVQFAEELHTRALQLRSSLAGLSDKESAAQVSLADLRSPSFRVTAGEIEWLAKRLYTLAR